MKLVAGMLVLLVGLFSCTDLDRSNPLDPKNSQSRADRLVVVEAFVNTADQPGAEFVSASLNGLDQLAENYDNRRYIILEHHIATSAATDEWSLDKSKDRYFRLEPQANQRGIPDVFIDGRRKRIQGAVDAALAYQQYRAAVQKELQDDSYFSLEAKAERQGALVEVSGKLARLGSSSADNVSIWFAMILDNSNQRYLVRDMSLIEALGDMSRGEIQAFDVDLETNVPANSAHSVLVVIQNKETLEIYQSHRLEIG